MIKKFFAFTSNPYVRVQWDHSSIAQLVILYAYLFGNWHWVAIVCLIGAPLIAFKEIWIDPREEHGGTIGKPDWDDLAFYLVSAALLLLLLRFTHHR